ncbi:MAG: VTT domain-containing protein [Paracoccaceae bacterium]|nr:MAG: VTT domain-containing protein [Paracoccaceae bacterium]
MAPPLTELIATADPALILALVAGMACITGLGVPGPASLVLALGGAAAAAGLVWLPAVIAAGTAGALAGDLGGLRLGASCGGAIRARAASRPRLSACLGRAEVMLSRHGLAAVFVTRWLIPPLGPATSLVAGAAGLQVLPFAGVALAGRVLWAALYAGLGWIFADTAQQAAGGAATTGAILAVAAVALGLAARRWRPRMRA